MMSELCPVCQGRGFVRSDFYSLFDINSTFGQELCRSCGGKGYIREIDDNSVDINLKLDILQEQISNLYNLIFALNSDKIEEEIKEKEDKNCNNCEFFNRKKFDNSLSGIFHCNANILINANDLSSCAKHCLSYVKKEMKTNE